MREHRNDDHPDAAAEACFAYTGEPCPEAEDDDFVNGSASLKKRESPISEADDSLRNDPILRRIRMCWCEYS